MKIKFLTYFFAFFMLSSCGFKVLKQERFFNIENLNVTGEKKISFALKNNLNIRPIKNNLPINLTIDAEKIINVKEKNEKNEITKYGITLRAKVEFYLVRENEKKYSFIIENRNEYSVANQHSRTLENEKVTTNLLVEDLSKKILAKINTEINDL